MERSDDKEQPAETSVSVAHRRHYPSPQGRALEHRGGHPVEDGCSHSARRSTPSAASADNCRADCGAGPGAHGEQDGRGNRDGSRPGRTPNGNRQAVRREERLQPSEIERLEEKAPRPEPGRRCPLRCPRRHPTRGRIRVGVAVLRSLPVVAHLMGIGKRDQGSQPPQQIEGIQEEMGSSALVRPGTAQTVDDLAVLT